MLTNVWVSIPAPSRVWIKVNPGVTNIWISIPA